MEDGIIGNGPLSFSTDLSKGYAAVRDFDILGGIIVVYSDFLLVSVQLEFAMSYRMKCKRVSTSGRCRIGCRKASQELRRRDIRVALKSIIRIHRCLLVILVGKVIKVFAQNFRNSRMALNEKQLALVDCEPLAGRKEEI